MRILKWEIRRRGDPPPDPDAPEVHAVEVGEPPTQRRIRRRIRRPFKRGLPKQMAVDQGMIKARRWEWYVAARWIPKWAINDSFMPEEDDGTGKKVKVVPWRLLTFRRHVEWPSYDDIVASGRALMVSQAGLTSFAFPVILGLVTLVGCLIALVYGALWPALALGLWFAIATPLWLYARYVRWWFNVYAIREAVVEFYENWINPRSDSWSSESIFKDEVRYRGSVDLRNGEGHFWKYIRWLFGFFFRLYWRFQRIGDVYLVDADGEIYGVIENVPDPREFATKVIRPLTTASERAHELTAKSTARTAELMAEQTRHTAQQTAYARLGLIAQLRDAGRSDEIIAQILGEDPEAIAAIPR
jgi:hypothetical protein